MTTRRSRITTHGWFIMFPDRFEPYRGLFKTKKEAVAYWKWKASGNKSYPIIRGAETVTYSWGNT